MPPTSPTVSIPRQRDRDARRRLKPHMRHVRQRSDAQRVLNPDGTIKRRGEHIDLFPAYYVNGVRHEADTTQPDETPVVGAAVGAVTEVEPPLPSDIGGILDVATKPLWSPFVTDEVYQGAFPDCYFIAVIDSAVGEKPSFIKSEDIIRRRPDGKFVVTFRRRLTAPKAVVVDSRMSANGCHPNPKTGAIALLVFEKAWAWFRTSENTGGSLNTYNSIGWGWPGSVMTDLGIKNIAVYPTASTAQTVLMAAVASDQIIAPCTKPTCPSGLLIGSHCYRLINVWVENGVTYVLLRNVWGVDGAAPSGNPDDGLVVMTYAQFAGDTSAIAVSVEYPKDVRLVTTERIPGDANNDGRVDFADFTILANNYGKGVAGGANEGDFDGDGAVNFADYVTLSNHYGQGLAGGDLRPLPDNFPPAENQPMKLDMLKPVMTGASITVPGKVGVDAVQLQFDSDADSVVLRPLNSDGTPDTKYNAVELTKGDGYTRGADGMGHYRGYIGTIPAVAKSHSVTFTKGTGIGAEVVVKTITLAPATTTTVDPVKPVDPVNPTTLTITIPNVPANVTAESVLLSDKTWRKL